MMAQNIYSENNNKFLGYGIWWEKFKMTNVMLEILNDYSSK